MSRHIKAWEIKLRKSTEKAQKDALKSIGADDELSYYEKLMLGATIKHNLYMENLQEIQVTRLQHIHAALPKTDSHYGN